MILCRVCLLQINAKESNPFVGGESLKVCVMKAVGIFFFLPLKKQLCKTTSLSKYGS